MRKLKTTRNSSPSARNAEPRCFCIMELTNLISGCVTTWPAGTRDMSVSSRHQMSDLSTYPAQRRKEKPHVGIFWLISGKPLIDSTPLGEAERYGDFLTHPRGHAEVWKQYQRDGIVPQEIEYEEPPQIGRA